MHDCNETSAGNVTRLCTAHFARDQRRRMAGAGSVRWRTQKLTFAATRYDPSAAGDRVSRTSSVGGCASDLPMFAGVQITFRRASNILSLESQVTGGDAVLTASPPYDPLVRYQ
jgi:hypothetical protein